jgi:hypothetical protein
MPIWVPILIGAALGATAGVVATPKDEPRWKGAVGGALLGATAGAGVGAAAAPAAAAPVAAVPIGAGGGVATTGGTVTGMSGGILGGAVSPTTVGAGMGGGILGGVVPSSTVAGVGGAVGAVGPEVAAAGSFLGPTATTANPASLGWTLGSPVAQSTPMSPLALQSAAPTSMAGNIGTIGGSGEAFTIGNAVSPTARTAMTGAETASANPFVANMNVTTGAEGYANQFGQIVADNPFTTAGVGIAGLGLALDTGDNNGGPDGGGPSRHDGPASWQEGFTGSNGGGSFTSNGGGLILPSYDVDPSVYRDPMRDRGYGRAYFDNRYYIGG